MHIQLDSRRVGKAILAKTMTAPGISELVTVPNVAMVSTGIDYPTSTGLITFTERHLQDLVASQDDPAIHTPRTKIGHTDPRFNARVTPDGDVLDGEPSLGSWQNLRLGDNGQTVYGDIVGVPKWFASIVSTAYPSRSIEGNFDVETVTGHKWSLVVDAVAMLGVIGPGVTTLDDLPILFSEEGPENVTVLEAKEGEPMSVIRGSKPRTIKAQTSEEEGQGPPNYRTGTEEECCSVCGGFAGGVCLWCQMTPVSAGGLCDLFELGGLRTSQRIMAVSDTPWSNFSDSDYTDDQYARACVYDRGKCSDDWTSKPAKERYSLPIREPDGTLNSNGVHAAAGRVGQVKDGCDAALSAAKASLRGAYSTLGEDPPDSIAASIGASGVQAQANLDDVRRGYYDSLENTQMWWWIRAIYFDPNELIVDDDEGGLYRVPFMTSGDTDGEVEFGDAIPVKIQYVDQPVAKASVELRASVAASAQKQPAYATYTVRAESRPGGCMTPEEAAALRERLGLTPEQLPDDADDATVARVVIQASSASPSAPEKKEETKPETAAASAEGNGNGARPPAEAITSTEEAGRIPQSNAMQLPEGTIVVDKATWEEVAGQARQGAELAAKTRDTERDNFIVTAIKAGKFPPSRKEHYLKAWKADPEGTRGLIDSLAPGLVPVEARGTAGTGKDETVEGAAAASAYDEGWLTAAERHRIKSTGPIQAGNVPTPMIVQGGD